MYKRQLWTGAYAPGGAFQAGAIAAAAGVALSLTGQYQWRWNSTVARLLLSLGLLAFTAAGVLTMAMTGIVLQYPRDAAAAIILLIEAAATLSIGAILLLLYTRLAVAQTPAGQVGPERSSWTSSSKNTDANL